MAGVSEDASSRIIRTLHDHPRGLGITEISRKTRIHRSVVSKHLEILLVSGQVVMMRAGMAKIYSLARRMPVRTLLNQSSEMIVILDEDLKILQVNDTLLRFFNERNGFFEGKSIDETQIRRIVTRGEIAAILADERSGGCSTERTSAINTETYHFTTKVFPVSLENGRPGVTIFIDDITTRKNYEARLVRSEALYRAIVEDQNDIICRRLPDGTITFVNGEFARFFGKIPGEVLGSKFYPTIPESDPGTILGNYLQDELPYRSEIFEHPVLLDTGEIKWIQWKNRTIRDTSGGVTEIQSVGRDITDLRERERELLITGCDIAVSPHAVVLFDINANVMYANGSFLSLFGYADTSEIEGRPLEKIIQRSGTGANIQQVITALRDTGCFSGPVRAQMKDGSDLDVEIYTRIILKDRYFPRCGIALLRPGNGNGKRSRQAGQGSFRGVVIVDPEGIIAYADAAFLDLTGEPREMLIGRSCLSVVRLDDPAIRDLASVPAESGSGWAGPAKIFRAGRDPAPVTIRVTHAQGSNGIRYYSQISVEDRDNGPSGNGSASASSPEGLEKMMEVFIHPTFIVDRDGRLIVWNRAMEVFTGVRKEEILGTKDYLKAFAVLRGLCPMLFEIIDLPGEEKRMRFPGIQQFGDTCFTESYIPSFKGGRDSYFLRKASRLLDASGRYNAVAESIIDITNWKSTRDSMMRMKSEINESLNEKIQQLVTMVDSG